MSSGWPSRSESGGIQKDIAAASTEKQRRNGIDVYANPQTAKEKHRKQRHQFPNSSGQGYIDQKSTGKAKGFLTFNTKYSLCDDGESAPFRLFLTLSWCHTERNLSRLH